MMTTCTWCSETIYPYCDKYWEGERVCYTCFTDAQYDQRAVWEVEQYEASMMF